MKPMRMIETKFKGPTSFKGSKVKATDCHGQSVTVDYNGDLDPSDAHFEAVKALIKKHYPTVIRSETITETTVCKGFGASLNSTGYIFALETVQLTNVSKERN